MFRVIRGKGKYLIIVLVSVLMLTSVAYAKGGPPGFAGRWVGLDEVDSSEVYLTLGGPPKGPYNVHWTESYFSLCDSRRGRGSGTADVTSDGISMNIDFVCFQTPATATITGAEYEYNPEENTLEFVYGEWPGVDTFYRPSDFPY